MAIEASSVAEFVGATTGLSIMVFMFQSRHHNLYEHEKFLMSTIEEVIKRRDAEHDDGKKMVLNNRLDKIVHEYRWVKRRYNCALVAFALLMFQISILVGCLLVYGGVIKPIWDFQPPQVMYTIWIAAFGFHIIGDIGMAYFNQRAIRKQIKIETHLSL